MTKNDFALGKREVPFTHGKQVARATVFARMKCLDLPQG
jgi:hypothetical protein